MEFLIDVIPENIELLMKAKNIWSQQCPIPVKKLRLLTLSHLDFDNNLLTGQMVVHEKISHGVVEIFQELLKIKFPIAKICLMEEYDGNDELSMADNNSSCFNHRRIAGSDITSMHAYGLAVDVNPVQNPYLTEGDRANRLKISPDQGKLYINRNNQRPGMLEPVVSVFARHGLDVWGGNWNLPIDYHHFQVDRANLAEFL